MKKIMYLMILAGLLPAVQAAQVWFDDAGDLSAWSISEKNAGEYVTVEDTWADVDANGKEFWLSSWNDARTSDGSWTWIWTDSGVTIETEKEYTLTVKVGVWDDGLEGDEVGTPAGGADQFWFAMSDWDAATYLAESYQWPTGAGDSQGYASYSVSFDTYGGNNAAAIGSTIGVEIDSVNWWNNFSVSEMNIDVVPEPATFGLLGFCGVGLFFTRRYFKR